MPVIVLADWARPLIRAELVAPFSPSQLYAVVLAPAMCAATAGAGPAVHVHASSIDWLTVLATAAIAALKPPKKQPKLTSKVAPDAEPRLV